VWPWSLIICIKDQFEKGMKSIMTKSSFLLQEDQDWGIVAMVLDRLFLWMFGAAAVVGK
jgi:hypothetical protein